MGYLEHFQLRAEPFSNAPVSRFFFESEQHRQALVRVMHVVERMKGLAVVVGEPGAGKTTLARRLLDRLSDSEYEAALLVIVHSGVTAAWLLKRIALQLGVLEPADEKLALLAQLYQRLIQIYEQGRKAVVLIDEAQMLQSKELMEEFRGLLNLEVPERKLLSFVFFGLPDVEQSLKLDPPLQQRVAMRCRIDRLSEDDTTAYIAHRLGQAGAAADVFSREAITAVHRASGGTPRAINTICDNALFEAFLAGDRAIAANLVEQVAENLGLGTRVQPASVPPAAANGNQADARGLQGEVAGSKHPPEGVGFAGGRAAAGGPKHPVDLAEIDRYLEGLRKS